MKAFVDPTLCTACGLCVDTCPDVFEMEDVAVVIVDTVPAELEQCVIEATESCPVEAISFE